MTANDILRSLGYTNQKDIQAARSIIAYITGESTDDVFFHGSTIDLTTDESDLFFRYISEYKSGKPVSKIVHRRSFWKHDFYVTEDVLDPRQDSEVLVEAVLNSVDKELALNILDIGTGSGCLIISLLSEFKRSHGLATDISNKALDIARKNAESIIGIDRLKFENHNFLEGISEKFDIIISNPPYIRSSDIASLDSNVTLFDPLIALDGGDTGLLAYEEIAQHADHVLNDNGIIFLEIGYDQFEDVCAIFFAHGYILTNCHKDTQNHNRVVVFRK